MKAGDRILFEATLIWPQEGTTTDGRVCVELTPQYLVWLPVQQIIGIEPATTPPLATSGSGN